MTLARQDKRLPERPADGRVLAGVCRGIARTFDLDVTLVRLTFLVLSLSWGIGLVLYGALWLLLPEQGDSSTNARMRARLALEGFPAEVSRGAKKLASGWYEPDRTPVTRPWSRRWLGLGLSGVGAILLVGSFGMFAWVTPVRAIGLAAIFLGIGTVVSMRSGEGPP